MATLDRLRTALALLTLSAALACGQGAPPQEAGTDAGSGTPAATAQAPSLSTATSLGVANAREPVPGLISAGQPTQEQFQALADAGYRHFVSLRAPTENGAGWEEAYAAAHGLDFVRIPITGAGDLTPENVEALDRILDATGGAPTVLYCGSANRVGALLALRAHWLDGMPAREAMDFGLNAGMTRMEPAVAQLLGLDGGGS